MAAFSATGGHAPSRRRRTGRPAGWTADKRTLFCAMLQSCLNVRRAADSVSLSHRSAYLLKARDPEFARQWAEALDNGYCDLELELMRQSIEGVERTEKIFDASTGAVRQVKTTHSYPPGLGLRLMAAHRDEVLAHRRAEAGVDAEDVGAQVRAEMDIVRERLRAEEDCWGEGDDDGSSHEG